jgi:hypothetical protein
VFNTIENSLLFADMRSASLTFDDEELAVELTRAYLAYLGVPESGLPEPRD